MFFCSLCDQQSIPAPPLLDKIHSPNDSIMLEDESGRIQLVGDRLKSTQLVTGVIIGALGIENNSGEFEVVDLCFPGMAPQENDEDLEENGMDVDGTIALHNIYSDYPSTQSTDTAGATSNSGSNSPEEYVGFISGLDIGSMAASEAQTQMLVEYLSGEEGGLDDQVSASRISRLVILGNSLAPIKVAGPPENDEEEDKKPVSIVSIPYPFPKNLQS